MDITREIAIKVRDVVAAGLSNGLGTPEPGQMCVEAAVCYAMGLPHSDKPTCVSPAIRALKIALNDKNWSSPQARAQGLARLALVQLGSAGGVDGREFARRVAEMTIRVFVPLALRAVASRVPSHFVTLCHDCHQGPRSVHSGHIVMVYGPEMGNGVVEFVTR